MTTRRALLTFVEGALLWSLALAFPYPSPDPNPDGCCQEGPSCANPCQGGMQQMQMPQMQPMPQMAMPMPQMQSTDCCQPGPSCQNPCQAGVMPAPQQTLTFTPVQPAGQSGCCMPPSATCDNPCQVGDSAGYMGAMPTGFGGGYSYSNPSGPYAGSYVGGYSGGATNSKTVYAPYPGEITFKLQQNYDPDTLLDHAAPGYQILAGNVANAIRAVLGPSTFINNIYFREGNVPGNPTAMPKVVVHCMVNGGSDAAGILAMSVKPDGTLGDGLKVYKDSFNAY